MQQRYGAGPRRADHHLRLAAGPRRACATSAACCEMPYGQVDKLTKLVPQNPANPVTLAQAIEGEPQAAGRARPRTRWSRACWRSRRSSKGLYRHASTHAAGIVIGDRPLERARAALPRPEVGHAGHPVQHEMGRAGRAREVRLPRPEDADRAEDGRRPPASSAASRSTSPRMPLDDKKTYEMLGRGETVGVFQVESAGMRKALVEMRADRFEDIIALVALYRPGPMANIPVYCARKHGEEEPDFIHPHARAGPEGDPRRHHLPGTGDADRADPVRLLARRGRPAAPRHGQEDQGRDGRAARRASSPAPSSAACRQQKADEIFDLLAKFADYGFNKIARRRLRAGRLPDRLPEGELPGRVPGRVDDARHVATPTSSPNSAARRSGSASGSSRPRSTARASTFEVHPTGGRLRIRYALAAVKGVGRARRREPRRRRAATGPSATSPTSPGASTRAWSTSARWRASSPPARSTSSTRTAPAPWRCSTRIMALANRAAGGSGRRPGRHLRRRRPRRGHPHAALRALAGLRAAAARIRRHRLLPLGPSRSTSTATCWSGCGCSAGRTSPAPCEAGASMGRVAATVLDRSERRTKTGIKMGIFTLSDQSGHFEAIIFSEGLHQYRDLLEPGRAVVLTLQASAEGDEVRARIGTAEPLEVAAREAEIVACGCSCATSKPIAQHRRAPARARRRRGRPGADARGRPARGRGQAARPLQGDAAGRRRAEGRAGRGGGRVRLRARARLFRWTRRAGEFPDSRACAMPDA